jgi:hypothetical protein
VAAIAAPPDIPQRVPPPLVAAAGGEEDNFDDPVVRLTPPPRALPPEPHVSAAAAGAALRQIKKRQLAQKLFRFVNATMTGDAQQAATLGLMGCDPDPDHDEQWWFDEIDRRRKRVGWDDMREWQEMAGLVPVGARTAAQCYAAPA